jgi:hypothetical protein
MLRKTACAGLAALLALAWSPGIADGWKDDGRGAWKREYKADGEWKEEYDDGNCKIERKRDKDGGYQEKVDCKRGPTMRPSVFYVPRK